MTASEPTTCEACANELGDVRTHFHEDARYDSHERFEDALPAHHALIRALEEQVHTQDEAWGRDAKAWLAEKEALEEERDGLRAVILAYMESPVHGDHKGVYNPTDCCEASAKVRAALDGEGK